jgi:hypothetical protein
MRISRMPGTFVCAVAVALAMLVAMLVGAAGVAYADGVGPDNAHIVTDCDSPTILEVFGMTCTFVITSTVDALSDPVQTGNIVHNCSPSVADLPLSWQYTAGVWSTKTVTYSASASVGAYSLAMISASASVAYGTTWVTQRSVTDGVTGHAKPFQKMWLTLQIPYRTATGYFQLTTANSSQSYDSDPLTAVANNPYYKSANDPNTVPDAKDYNTTFGPDDNPDTSSLGANMTENEFKHFCPNFAYPKPGAPAAPSVSAIDHAVSVTPVASSTGGPANSYTVTAQPGGHTCKVVETMDLLNPAMPLNPCTVIGLTDGITYTFTDTANNSQGTSTSSPPSQSVVPGVAPGVPAAPTAAVTGDGQATVTVTAPSAGGRVDSYEVVSSPGGLTCAVTGAADSCKVNGLTDGTAYTFTVTASNRTSTSDPSPASNSLTPFPPPATPAAPSATLVADPNAVYEGSATVTLTPPTSGAAVDFYTVTANPGGQTCKTNSIVPSTSFGSNWCIMSSLVDGTPYTFTATATNAAGTSSSSPPSNSVTVLSPLPAPGIPSAPRASMGDGQATVDVGDQSAGARPDRYTVTADPGGQTCIVYVPSFSCTVSGLTDGDSYTFTSTATDAGGTSASSPPSNSVTLPAGAPGAPASVAVRIVNGQVRVTIAAPVSGGGPDDIYKVTASPGGETCETQQPNPVTDADCGPAGLIAGTTYTFVATDTNAIGTSPPSPPVSFTLPSVAGPGAQTLPGVPTGVKAVAGNGSASVSWIADAPYADSYTVTASPNPGPGKGECSVNIRLTGRIACPVTGLTNGTSYTFTITATNSVGPAWVVSNKVTPTGPAPAPPPVPAPVPPVIPVTPKADPPPSNACQRLAGIGADLQCVADATKPLLRHALDLGAQLGLS